MRRAALIPLLLAMPLAMAAVPVDIYPPAREHACSMARPCPVAVLGPGYGMAGSDYGFVVRYLNEARYLVLVLRDSAGGVQLDRSGRMSEQVQAMARTASQSIAAAADANAPLYRAFDWRRLLLVGHSLGGDSAARFAADYPGRVSGLISLDSRRVALPRSADIPVLAIRASDTVADPGVLPDEEERKRYGICVVRIEGARHNDMHDGGSAQLKAMILSAIGVFLAPAPLSTYACARDTRLD